MRIPYTAFLLLPLLPQNTETHRAEPPSYQHIQIQSAWTGSGYTLCGSCRLPKNIISTASLVPLDEPGEPVVLSGTVFRSDGVSPDSGIVLFLYQTDAEGYYHRPHEDVFHPRLFGWLMTGADGRYEIHTIKPAPEILSPNEPAHIHVHIWSKDMPEHFLHEFWFDDDSRISPTEREQLHGLGEFSPLVTLTKGADGILRGTRNIRVRPAPPWRYEKDESPH